ncbi:DUF2955 domain-containing protein [Aeromonas diversa]|uniref:DUF2955 domain-containing protein n=1 Tax=Aeromonas diversa TaxID=502790 RepID=UPI003461EF11
MSGQTWRHGALRLGIVPMVALATEMLGGTSLPMLTPIFTVILLLLMPGRPPLSLLAKLLLVVLLCSALIGLMARLTGSNLFAFWLTMIALVVALFARLERDPADLMGLLGLIVTTISLVLVPSDPGWPLAIAPLMGGAIVKAILWTLFAFALWPRPWPSWPAPSPATANAPSSWRVLGKSAALLLAVALAIAAQDQSAILIGATLANLLRANDPTLTRSNARTLLTANLLGALVALPLVLIIWLLPSPPFALLCALAASLWLSGRLACGWPIPVIQSAMTVLLTLLASLLPSQSLMAMGDRLLTVLLTVLYCALVMRLLHPAPALREAS